MPHVEEKYALSDITENGVNSRIIVDDATDAVYIEVVAKEPQPEASLLVLMSEIIADASARGYNGYIEDKSFIEIAGVRSPLAPLISKALGIPEYTNYRVSWTIDVSADSAREAAQKVFESYFDSSALDVNPVFDVRQHSRKVDLSMIEDAPQVGQPEFTVSWTVTVNNIDDESAARQVYKQYFQMGHDANAFKVWSEKTKQTTNIDFSQQEEDDDEQPVP